MASSICRALTIVPRRAMSSVGSKSPTTTTTTSATSGDTSSPSSQSDDTQIVKKEQKEEFINYNSKPGYKPDPNSYEIYLNPLLTPPPRSPRSPDDFSSPSRLGHWVSLGMDYTNPVADKYHYHELLFILFSGFTFTLWCHHYLPDYKYREWAKREAFLRTTKREALGLPLIDRNVVDPERVVLPTEEEIGDFEITM